MNSNVKFIRRKANQTAYGLARVAPTETSFHIYSHIPTCIESIITIKLILVKKRNKGWERGRSSKTLLAVLSLRVRLRDGSHATSLVMRN